MSGILGICNRTENWKTASTLLPVFLDNRAVGLIRELGEPRSTRAEVVRAELFWKGIRDWLHAAPDEKSKNDRKDRLFKTYRTRFASLRNDVSKFARFKPLQPHNYSTSNTKKLLSNLAGTEIDIVLETPTCFYIGEAKFKSGFGSDGRNVLVHQLVRQYVAARVLADILCEEKRVIPFVVASREPSRVMQVEFMQSQRWMDKRHVLTWKTISEIG